MLAQQESVSQVAVAGVAVTARLSSSDTKDYVNLKLTANKGVMLTKACLIKTDYTYIMHVSACERGREMRNVFFQKMSLQTTLIYFSQWWRFIKKSLNPRFSKMIFSQISWCSLCTRRKKAMKRTDPVAWCKYFVIVDLCVCKDCSVGDRMNRLQNKIRSANYLVTLFESHLFESLYISTNCKERSLVNFVWPLYDGYMGVNFMKTNIITKQQTKNNTHHTSPMKIIQQKSL